MRGEDIESRIVSVIRDHLDMCGHTCPDFTSATRLVRDTDLFSDDGLMLAIDFNEEFGIALPEDFNVAVYDSGKRDRTFGELVQVINDEIAKVEEDDSYGKQ